MTIKQLSIFVENKPGRLSDVTHTLKDGNINIRAITTADSSDFGILRLIVDDTDKAIECLKKADYLVKVTNVIAVTAEDKPGGMASIMKTLYKANISVEYMYSAFLNPSDVTACLILRVDSNENAIEALTDAGYRLLAAEELAKF